MTPPTPSTAGHRPPDPAPAPGYEEVRAERFGEAPHPAWSAGTADEFAARIRRHLADSVRTADPSAKVAHVYGFTVGMVGALASNTGPYGPYDTLRRITAVCEAAATVTGEL